MLLGAATAAAQGSAIYNSDPGRFRVGMPGNPKMTTVPVPVGSGQTVPMTVAEVRLRNAMYQASYVDYPERIARAVAVDLLLDKVHDGAAAGNQLRGERKLALGRFLGREYLIVHPNGVNTAVRTWWVRGRLYQLTVAGGAGIEGQPDTRRFFDSTAASGWCSIPRSRPTPSRARCAWC
jgi:hypothetical protein